MYCLRCFCTWVIFLLKIWTSNIIHLKLVWWACLLWWKLRRRKERLILSRKSQNQSSTPGVDDYDCFWCYRKPPCFFGCVGQSTLATPSLGRLANSLRHSRHPRIGWRWSSEPFLQPVTKKPQNWKCNYARRSWNARNHPVNKLNRGVRIHTGESSLPKCRKMFKMSPFFKIELF